MLREIYLAGGCYWGTEKFLASLQGVTQTEVGFANGFVKVPSYDTVKHTETGHAETVHVTYDDKELPLEMLLELFYNIIDPTSLNKQGLDAGTQYGRAFIPWMTRIWPLPGVRWRSCKPGLTSPLSWNASRWTASIRQRNITRSIWIETRTGIAMFRWG